MTDENNEGLSQSEIDDIENDITNNTQENKISKAEEDLAAEWGAALEESKSADLFNDFNSKQSFAEDVQDLEMLMDIPISLSVELGKTHIPIKNLMQLINGSVVELDSLAGEPLDIMVNGYLIAQGEVVVVNDKFGIRLTDVITPNERIRRLNMNHN